MPVLFQDGLEQRRQRGVSDLAGLRRAHAPLPLSAPNPDYPCIFVDVLPLQR